MPNSLYTTHSPPGVGFPSNRLKGHKNSWLGQTSTLVSMPGFSDSPKMAILFLGSLGILVFIDNKYKKESLKIVSSESK